MSNNKQSSLEWLIEKYTIVCGLGSKELMKEHIDRAKAMHNEEIRKAYCYGEHYKDTKLTTDYYNETFGE